jgi:putative oxidoreductase
MINQLFFIKTEWQNNSLAIIRILCGLLMGYHGLEIFNSDIMKSYQEWDIIKTIPFPVMMVYLGKGIELVTGLCFVFGLFTRLAAMLMAVNMLFICFYIGGGKFYYEDQTPFLFAILAVVFFFVGSVKFGLDNKIFKSKSHD